MVSPEVTVFEPAVKSPAENRTPVVLSIVEEPPTLMNAPATVPEPVIENTTAAEVAFTAGLAEVDAEKAGVLRVPE